MSFFTPGAGRQAIAGGGQITFKFGPDDGAEDLSMFETVLPPVGGAFPHLHREFEEAFYVLEGEVRFLLGDEWHSGPRGTAVHVPRNTVHAFSNESGAQARILVMHTPAAAVRMIEELADLPIDASRQDAGQILARYATEPASLPSEAR
jgi:quercetin dioxygenase-like cupin family protein